MIITQAEFALITNPKIRQRTLQLPVRYGSFGERKRCPVKPGGVYKIIARPPYELYKTRAEREPTRPRAVLHLIDLCLQPQKTITITVLEVVREDETWAVRFEKGEHPERIDRDLYLCRDNDFTATASRQTVKGDPPYCPPFAEDLAKARAKAKERRVDPQRQLVNKMRNDADMLHRSLTDMKLRNRARRIAHDLAKLAVDLPSELVVHSEVTLARDEPHEDADSPHPRVPFATPDLAA